MKQDSLRKRRTKKKKRKEESEENVQLDLCESDEEWEGSQVPWWMFIVLLSTMFLPLVVMIVILWSDNKQPMWNDLAILGVVFGIDPDRLRTK